jgi:hypothetical protein
VKRILISLAVAGTALHSARADSLPDIAQFAQSICSDIPQGNLTKTNIQGQIGANAGLLAKIITGDVNVSGSKTDEIYKGIPFDKLPNQIPTASMCKLEVVKLLLAQKPNEAPPPASPRYQKIICYGEFEINCGGPHDIYYVCGYGGTDQDMDNNACAGAPAKASRTSTVSAGHCGYAMITAICN